MAFKFFRPLADAGGAASRRSSAWTTHPDIIQYIRSNNLPAVVRGDGTLIRTAELQGRMLRSLYSIIRQTLGVRAPDVQIVSPIELKQYMAEQEATRPRSGSQVAEVVQAGNQTVEYVLGRAIDARASDIYLDIRKPEASLSFRIYGKIIHIEKMDAEIGRSVARGLYSRANTSQWTEKAACDTACTYEHNGRIYRVRCNSVPDIRGNALSCRIRDPAFVLPLSESGYSEHQAELIQRICNAPGGLVLITGETNSGKSTTLSSLMMNAPRCQRMIEIADPVEVEFEHCTHIELDHYRDDAQKHFKDIMAATVRQNPDSLVLGEIRDTITAMAAQNMAIQGKRVFSTLHTQSCVAAIPRLASLGVDPHLLALREFIAGIVNQNLIPVLCPACAQEHHEKPKRDRYYRDLFGDAIRFINPEGCNGCTAGVTGQTLVAEVYPLYLDRKDAHKFIARQELFRLYTYMRKEFGIESKEEHARSKVMAGLLDPEITEGIIGEWSQPAKNVPAGWIDQVGLAGEAFTAAQLKQELAALKRGNARLAALLKKGGWQDPPAEKLIM